MLYTKQIQKEKIFYRVLLRVLCTWQYHDEALWRGYQKGVPFCQHQRLTFCNVFFSRKLVPWSSICPLFLSSLLFWIEASKASLFREIIRVFLFLSQRQQADRIEWAWLFHWCIFLLSWKLENIWKNLIAFSLLFY